MNTTIHFQKTMTYEKFNKPFKVPTEYYVDMLLDWRLELMNKRTTETNPASQIYLDFEIEATDTLINKLT